MPSQMTESEFAKNVASLDALYAATKNLQALMEYHEGNFYGREVIDNLYKHYQLHGENPMSMTLALIRSLNNLQPQLHPLRDKAPRELVSGVPKDQTDKALSDLLALIKGLIVLEEKAFGTVMRELPLKRRDAPYTHTDLNSITRKSKLWSKLPAHLREIANGKYSQIKTFYWVEDEPLWVYENTFCTSVGYKWRDSAALKNSKDVKIFYLWLLNNYDWHYIDRACMDMQNKGGIHYVVPTVRLEITSLFNPNSDELDKILNPGAWWNELGS